MKTHEIARMLQALAQALRSGPNIELSQMTYDRPTRAEPNPSNIPTALSALVSLAEFDKAQWRAVIQEYNLQVEVKASESSRDVLGKILNHLAQDTESRTRLQNAVLHKPKSDVSPELMNALNFLLK